MKSLAAVLILALTTFAAAQHQHHATVPDLPELQQMMARLAPTEIRVDTSALSAGDRQALAKVIEAARLLDGLYMEQLWGENLQLFRKLQQDTSPLGQARLRYFWINKGPWSELDEHRAFLPGVPPKKPEGANFYPEDMTKDEFESWVKTLPEAQQEQARGYFTVVRRDPKTKKLELIPYSRAYRDRLERAAALLREAAKATDNATLRRFLELRADAFLSDDYYASDVAWMDLDAPVDVTFGPYETYTDELFGYKAAFEAYVNLRDDAETEKVAFFSGHLQEIENNLPIPAEHRNPKLGALAPIRVVNEVFASGDGNHGVQTAAYNLPNDERVVREKGSKRVMLKNVQEAKFNQVLLPISHRVLAAAAQRDVDFDSFFTHILAHELVHGLGPHQIKPAGRETTPRKELRELYGAIEEAKADATGLFALQHLLDQGQLPGVSKEQAAAYERRMYTTFLASAFRSMRFGVHEAHGRGMALQFNYLVRESGFTAQPDGTFAVDFGKIKSAVRDLTRDLLMLEATGDYAGARKMLDELAVVTPAMQRALDKLKDIPTDIEPLFITADQVSPPAMKTPPGNR